MSAKDITPKGFRCGDVAPTCPAAYDIGSAEIVLQGRHYSDGESDNRGLPKRPEGDGRIAIPIAFLRDLLSEGKV
jgi:hypothetical protein